MTTTGWTTVQGTSGIEQNEWFHHMMREQFILNSDSKEVSSFEEMKDLDRRIDGTIKNLAQAGMDRLERAEFVSEAIISLLEASQKVASQVSRSDEYDAIEEIVNRWTGYLSYYNIVTPACLLPDAPPVP